MLTPEEFTVLHYLHHHPGATAASMALECLPGQSANWIDRIASNLDWLGYVIVYQGAEGDVSGMQITDRGRRALAGDRQPRSRGRGSPGIVLRQPPFRYSRQS